jgi:hypothetical protein
MRQLAVLLRATDSSDRVTLVFLILFVLACGWIVIYRDRRQKALAQVASRLGLEFRPTLSADWFGLKSAGFYKVGDTFSNCMRGSIAGRDTLIFDPRTSSGPDYQPRGEIMVDQTVVGFRVPPDTYCRDRGVLQSDDLAWRVEKVGEWIFVFQGYVRVKPADIEAFVEQARSLYQTAIDPGAFQLTLRAPFSRY